jgi:hypothetical protein
MVMFLRLVMVLVIVVSLGHKTESSIDTESKKGNEGSLHLLPEYGCCQTFGRV